MRAASGQQDRFVMTPYLVYEMQRRAYPLRTGDVAIGRDPRCDIVIPEPIVSRSHARIHTTRDGITLENFGATGTRLNGLAITEATPVAPGDSIEIASAVLTVGRGPLPVGVSLATEHTRQLSVDDIAARRPTIRRPILPHGEPQRDIARPHWPWLLAILVAAVAVGLLISRL